jgi:hypothetical protein
VARVLAVPTCKGDTTATLLLVEYPMSNQHGDELGIGEDAVPARERPATRAPTPSSVPFAK